MRRCTKSKFSIKFPSGILKLFENLLNIRVCFFPFFLELYSSSWYLRDYMVHDLNSTKRAVIE